ncbi:uncharacterized protein DUF317 [Streptomyces sp. KhCrAH-43]|uniref:DUF317 domain-containing protein n=1 Tax=unclassified Streptomyces TaxID=2593676 RepID=UPI000368B59D|nr:MULTISPECIES: DUF317 domain-containing protein [unclassified Streptomyces]MYS36689.1 DUF317 domain-containing protein [Streptomyces sp. SID4920]MYX69160.1 DUF317 domain-containing protein [Streptomyces sp. SID8373]RAJ62012.1 uncharacterized protein DUF317 [Streptomyces sp. KhCrAH-43]
MSTAPETVEVAYVAPRHLAGGGDPAWITVPLHRACGWSHGNDPLMPRVLLSSPDQTAFLRLEPDPGGQWWRLLHAAGQDQPAWYASFGGHTPVELIAAVTDALTGPAPAAATSDPFEPLRQQSWRSAPGVLGFVASDGTAFVQRLGDGRSPCQWSITATLGPDRRVWQARFDENTPPHLVTAFTTALADPRPVGRANGGLGLPTMNPNIISRKVLDVPVAYVAAALEERVDALAARGPAPSATHNLSPPAPRISPRRR